MASFTVAVRFFFFFSLLLACSSPQAQARESQFFSKAARYDTAKEAAPAKEDLPSAKKDEPVQYKPDTAGNGFGLYGHGPEKLPPATTGSTPSFPTYNYNNNAGDNFNTENVPSEFNNNEFNGVSYGNKEFNTAGYPDNSKNYYANNRPAYKAAGNIPENELNGGSYYKGNNEEPNARYPSSANQREQYGMSDTRILDNGRYFYDMNAEESYRDGARYDPARGSPGASYGSFGGRGENFANGGYPDGNNYNNKGNGYQENNSLQGYQNNGERSQENTQENQEEYVP